MDIPRDQMPPPKRHMDAGPAAANAVQSNNAAEKDRQRSLLDIGEDALTAKKAAQLAAAKNADNSGLS